MWSSLVLCVAAVFISSTASERVHYNGYQLLSVEIKTQHEFNVINQLQEHGLDSEIFDFWRFARVGGIAEFLVPPTSLEAVHAYLSSNGMTARVEIPDFEDAIEQSQVKSNINAKNAKLLWEHNEYYTLSEIEGMMKNLDATDGRVKLFTSPHTTYEGNEMYYLQISTDFNAQKPAILIEAGAHAREWISPAAVIYSVDKLLHENGQDQAQMLEYFDWFVFFVANPDGYEYSFIDRNWRKNRRLNSGSTCKGVDLNRNFDAGWGGAGSSSYPCSNTYRGTRDHSEPETQNIQSLVRNIGGALFGGRLISYLSVHSYSEMILTPFNYKQYGPSDPDVQTFAKNAGAAYKAVDNRELAIGPGWSTIYLASGGAHDWAYETEGTPYSYTYELRPAYGTSNGFVLNPGNITFAGDEVFASLASFSWDFARTSIYQDIISNRK